MTARVREEEKAPKHRKRRRVAEEADKFEVALGVTVASLRRFRFALIGPTQGFPRVASAVAIEKKLLKP